MITKKVCYRLSVATVAFVFSGVAIADKQAKESNDALRKRIFDHWTAREKKMSTARYEWKSTRHLKPGALFSAEFAKAHDLKGDAVRLGVPAKEVSFKIKSTLLIHGDWVKYRTRGFSVSNKGTVGSIQHISSYDGKSSRMLTFKKDGTGRGSICGETKNTDVGSYPLLPLLGHLRPVDERFRTLNRRFVSIADRDATIGKHKCIILSIRGKRAWVDTKRMIVLRWDVARGGGVTARMDVEYEKDSKAEWSPKSWTMNKYVNGDPKKTIQLDKITVTKHQVGLPLKRKDFELKFPRSVSVYVGQRKVRGPLPPDEG